jgi:hypothetical protein
MKTHIKHGVLMLAGTVVGAVVVTGAVLAIAALAGLARP